MPLTRPGAERECQNGLKQHRTRYAELVTRGAILSQSKNSLQKTYLEVYKGRAVPRCKVVIFHHARGIQALDSGRGYGPQTLFGIPPISTPPIIGVVSLMYALESLQVPKNKSRLIEPH